MGEAACSFDHLSLFALGRLGIQWSSTIEIIRAIGDTVGLPPSEILDVRVSRDAAVAPGFSGVMDVYRSAV